MVDLTYENYAAPQTKTAVTAKKCEIEITRLVAYGGTTFHLH
jgi:hypothetical protein